MLLAPTGSGKEAKQVLSYKSNLPKEYWDGLQSKEDLYKEFDSMAKEIQFTFAKDPDQAWYYKDGEFKAVADSVNGCVKTLQAVLPDIVDHLTDSEVEKERVKTEAFDLFRNNFDFDRPDEIAKFAEVMRLALSLEDDKSMFRRIESGNGIPEARAAYRAFARYRAFKNEDKAKLEAFKLTPEYHIQETEIKLGLRDHIEVPE